MGLVTSGVWLFYSMVMQLTDDQLVLSSGAGFDFLDQGDLGESREERVRREHEEGAAQRGELEVRRQALPAPVNVRLTSISLLPDALWRRTRTRAHALADALRPAHRGVDVV